jgi:hypothetical protein
MKKSSLFCLFLLMLSLQAKAQQLTWGGLIDFELRKGGESSRALLNQTPNENWTLFTPNIRLFATAELSEKWWADVTLQADYYGQEKLHSMFFSLFSINYQPFDFTDLTIQAGRFITPFGYNHRQVLSSDNPFTNFSLESAWNLRVDKKMGYFPTGAIDYNSTPGMAPVYQRRYTQGISINGTLGKHQLVDYALALTTAPASGFLEAGQGGAPSFIGRVVIQPVIWAKLGTSFSHGGYMMRDEVKNGTLTDKELQSFKQTIYAFDATLSYSYFEVTGQWLYNNWGAPLMGIPFTADIDPPHEKLDLNLTHWLVQTKVNLPFLVGSYVAARYENMVFGDNPSVVMFPDGNNPPWLAETNRYEFVFGYKFTRTILGKLSWQDGRNVGTDRDDYVFTAQLSVGL